MKIRPTVDSACGVQSSVDQRARQRRWLTAMIPLILMGTCVAKADDKQGTAAQAEMFEKRVRPLLLERCVGCHGAKKQESGLRLDNKTGLLKGGDGGHIVVPGQPDASAIIRAVKRDGALKMPPEKPLSAAEVDLLIDWVRNGAFFPETTSPPTGSAGTAASIAEAAAKHWAFRPVSDPMIPAMNEDDWSRGPIDRFIKAKHLSESLSPTTEADKRTLLRRVTFDLIGLPPSVEELQDFLADERPDAYERLVDRLLASPHHGERWGRHWLDVARYADTKGYVFFEEKKFAWGWTYRDYVIHSLNSDLPFDRFVVEQLAADRLQWESQPARSKGLVPDESLTAMGFLTLGGRFMNNLHDVIDDRIDVVTRGLLGLTATCSRCHDHKFDPIPQADYYSLYGVFRSSLEPTLPPEFKPAVATDEYKKFSTEMQVRLAKLTDFVDGKHRNLVTSTRTRGAEYLLAAQSQMDKPPQDDFMLISDTNDVNPAMILRWQFALETAKKQPHPVWRPWTELAVLPAEGFAGQAPMVLNRLKEESSGGAMPIRTNKLVLAAVTTDPAPQSLNDVATRYGELFKQIDARWQMVVKEVTGAGQAVPSSLSDADEEEVRQVLYGPEAPADIPRALGWGFLSLFPDRATQGEYQKLVKEVEQWSMTTAGAPPRAMVLVDDAVPFEPRVFARGNPNRPGSFVKRQSLAIATPNRSPFESGSGRLELARTIVAPKNPLTARVFVNRVWLHHFGSGLVKTPADFGLRSDPPSHPELLDHLATRFVQRGWSMKQLHRDMVTSASYRLSADSSAKSDPDNKWHARRSRRRLDWESLRDAILMVSGDWNDRIGGESLDIVNGFVARRTLYGMLDRLDVPNLLTTFDFPSPAATNPQRDETTVAPQALFLMNGPLAVEAATRLLRRPEWIGPTETESKLRALFLICFSRNPSPHELASSRQFLSENPTPERWLSLAQSLLLTNEFAYVD